MAPRRRKVSREIVYFDADAFRAVGRMPRLNPRGDKIEGGYPVAPPPGSTGATAQL